MVNIGKKIRELREDKGFTLKQLADLVECTSSLISQLERDKADPSISMLKKIAKALNVNIVDFFMESVKDEDIVTGKKDRIDIQLQRWDAKIQSLVKTTKNKILHGRQARGRVPRDVFARGRGIWFCCEGRA
jgi:transcriptional regulator with XRE-family HTH domain